LIITSIDQDAQKLELPHITYGNAKNITATLENNSAAPYKTKYAFTI
jgi:hypothetical protein